MPKLIIAESGMNWPSISPDGTRVLGGNGKLKLVNLMTKIVTQVTVPGAGFLRGGWGNNTSILIQNDDANGWIYEWINGKAVVYKEGNYKGNQFRVSQLLNFLVCVDSVRLNYNDKQLGAKNYSVDLCEQRTIANNDEGGSKVRVWNNGVVTRNYQPITAPHVVRASVNGYFGYGYFGKSAIIKPDGSQVLVNLVPKESPGKVVLDSTNKPWVVTASESECYLRPLEHKEKTAIILKSGAVRVDAVAVGNKVIVACDLTSGLTSIFEANFTEALVPIETIPIPPEPPMAIPNHLDLVKAARVKYDDLEGEERAGKICNQVAWDLRSEGCGLFFKNSGTEYNDRSIDVLIYKKSSVASGGETFDILKDAEGVADPAWARTKPTGMGDVAKWRPATDPGGIINPPLPPTDPARDLLKSIRNQIDEFFGD